jgi:hypothetical protein
MNHDHYTLSKQEQADYESGRWLDREIPARRHIERDIRALYRAMAKACDLMVIEDIQSGRADRPRPLGDVAPR